MIEKKYLPVGEIGKNISHIEFSEKIEIVRIVDGCLIINDKFKVASYDQHEKIHLSR